MPGGAVMPSVLITGAGRGFGRALADVYRRRGWLLFPLVRDRNTAASLEAPDSHPIIADVTSPDLEDAIGRVIGVHTDSLDLLINNAGSVRKLRWLAATEIEDMEAMFRVHCVGALRCTRAALPWLRVTGRGTVVNVSSRFGSIGRIVAGDFRGIYAYSIAKAAQNMLTACLDQELRGTGIRVFAVHPGRLLTAAAASDADVEPAEAAERLADWVAGADREASCALRDLMAGTPLPW